MRKERWVGIFHFWVGPIGPPKRALKGPICNELRVFETGLALGGKTRIRMQEGKSEVALNLRGLVRIY